MGRVRLPGCGGGSGGTATLWLPALLLLLLLTVGVLVGTFALFYRVSLVPPPPSTYPSFKRIRLFYCLVFFVFKIFTPAVLVVVVGLLRHGLVVFFFFDFDTPLFRLSIEPVAIKMVFFFFLRKRYLKMWAKPPLLSLFFFLLKYENVKDLRAHAGFLF